MAEIFTGPGFFDLQVNGFGGVDFNAPGQSRERIAHAMAAMHTTGVTRCLPTLITGAHDDFARCAAALEGAHPAIAGLHMEGPYINPEDGPRGAHPRAHVREPSLDDFSRRQEAARGAIRLVTLAPEMPGALALIEHLVANDVVVAIGHSAATAAQIRDAVSAGARLATHLGNGSPRMLPKHGNLIFEQLAIDGLFASFVVDGHHLPEASVKVMMRAKEPHRCVLVTDAVAPAGCPPGRYTLGDVEVELGNDGVVRQPGQTRPSGSALRLPDAVARVVAITGWPLAQVWAMASDIPAALLDERPRGQVRARWEAACASLEVEGPS